MRALLVLLFALPLLLAGCSDDGAAPAETVDCEFGVLGDGSCAPPPAPPQPVNINDAGDLTQGIDETWTWEIEPGAKRFSVEVIADGLNGAPLYEMADFVVSLKLDSRVQAETVCGDTCFQGGSPPATLISFSPPSNEEGFPDEAESVGEWTLTFTSGPQAAAYRLDVSVIY